MSKPFHNLPPYAELIARRTSFPPFVEQPGPVYVFEVMKSLYVPRFRKGVFLFCQDLPDDDSMPASLIIDEGGADWRTTEGAVTALWVLRDVPHDRKIERPQLLCIRGYYTPEHVWRA
ncbi:hypothetical protein FAES_1836 [Fibrella aestuarina BUZ 2]|uniref:Uncharacterized protein n=1 Tax=Fibrella aestuarina BUZ 2 TaxID=1166018 RepID=I0K6U3_9BACT|nr:hypothetical protein [Fibrella aestuarina]CCG99846.1 hypothetical protein FAES_1836 [Fibrella aestuarina BUZ 2]